MPAQNDGWSVVSQVCPINKHTLLPQLYVCTEVAHFFLYDEDIPCGSLLGITLELKHLQVICDLILGDCANKLGKKKCYQENKAATMVS